MDLIGVKIALIKDNEWLSATTDYLDRLLPSTEATFS